jgi:major membrane immunogen (membrane-anchored lipoprotein)
MKHRALVGAVVASLLLTACVTNDFKVVDALRRGMDPAEANATIASFGFQRRESLSRPQGGWPTKRGAFSDLAWRAGVEETRVKEEIASAEFYPVHHGLLGYGELFLFYGKEGKLVSYYRHQIN